MILHDQAARDAIENELDVNLMVLAGAGAGKTHSLVGRMVASVRRGVVEVDRMAAITFTRKAAGEMRSRFFLRLQKEREKADGEERDRIERALAMIDQCFVGTIHSFCGRMLRERPIEAKLPPDFTEIEQVEESRIRRESWDRFIHHCYSTDDPVLAELAERGLETEDLFDFFVHRAENADLPLAVDPVERPDLTSAVTAVTQLIDTALPYMLDFPEATTAKVYHLFRRMDLYRRHRSLHSDPDRIELLQMAARMCSEGATKGNVTLKNWSDRAFAVALRDTIIPEIIRTHVAPALEAWRQYLYPPAASLIDRAVANYATERRSNGTLNFQDLLTLTSRLLREHTDVRRFFSDRYRVLFVDEFQDTDPIQAELVLYLGGDDPGERDWRRCRPRPGSLFLVGDDKQSIYRFRRADVDTVRLVQQRVESSGGRTIKLTTSFRSLGTLCGWFNRACPPLFDAFDRSVQAEFAPMHVHRPDGADSHCVRRISIGKVTKNYRKEIVPLDAARIADFIAAAIEGTTSLNGSGADGDILPPRASAGDFMILSAYTKMLDRYARELEARGIPFDLTGGDGFGKHAGLRALLDVFEVIHDPNDPLALLACLRGPLCGLGDDELYAWHRSGGTFNYRREIDPSVAELVDPATCDRIAQTYARIDAIAQLVGSAPPSAAYEQAVEILGLLPNALAGQMSSSAAGSLLRALAVVRHLEQRGSTWAEITSELRRIVEEPKPEIGEMTLDVGRTDVVRLMNLHKAKGLQAKVVFLCDPTATGRDGVDFHVSRTGDAPFIALPVTDEHGWNASEIAEPVGWPAWRDREKDYLDAERARLVYVGATRAENMLVVSVYDPKAGAGPWGLLYPAVRDVPELEHANFTTTPAVRASAAEAEPIAAERTARIQRLSVASIDTHAATDGNLGRLASSDDRTSDDRNSLGTGGTAFGSAVHELFQAAVEGRLLEEGRFIDHLIARHALKPEQRDDVLHALQTFRHSALWSAMQSSPEHYAEVPLAAHVDGAIMHGVADLIYRDDAGWHIVDYKTDAVGDPAELADHYDSQLRAYASAWAAATGEPIADAAIYAVDSGVSVTQMA